MGSPCKGASCHANPGGSVSPSRGGLGALTREGGGRPRAPTRGAASITLPLLQPRGWACTPMGVHAHLSLGASLCDVGVLHPKKSRAPVGWGGGLGGFEVGLPPRKRETTSLNLPLLQPRPPLSRGLLVCCGSFASKDITSACGVGWETWGFQG